ncbi:uncharacterized protein LOC143206605 [Rhynchophorus ferrugineus]|uniref:Protein sleepless n=1 Tax=Rhynchophorus ferrugineus TaxID=354439 RepID=A0A834HLP2_RHYFE|nr:hypothetical protein GWI33_023151 [Rhynchophorus ferrugineus]KAF7264484.1 hypothetical protein GWI33_023149 [Rhynchophorus ferrugineus]
MSRSIILPIALLLFYFKAGSALYCYQCIGNNSSDCENNLSLVTQQNCTVGFVCAHYSVESNSVTTINRGCSNPDVCSSLDAKNTHLIGTNRTLNYCRVCNNTDYCNSAFSLEINHVFLLVSSIAFCYFNL